MFTKLKQKAGLPVKISEKKEEPKEQTKHVSFEETKEEELKTDPIDSSFKKEASVQETYTYFEELESQYPEVVELLKSLVKSRRP